MTETAIRHPKRGKAHRPVVDAANAHGYTNHRMDGMESTACDFWISTEAKGLTERVPLAQTAPEDRCRRCWPTPTTRRETEPESDQPKEGER